MVKETGFYALLSRMRYISRWGLMRSSIPENVQEHSHETAVYAHARSSGRNATPSVSRCLRSTTTRAKF